MTMLNGISAAVYFDVNAAPSAIPAAHHHAKDVRERAGCPNARTTQYHVPAAAANRGASGVASTRPAAESGISAKIRAVKVAALAPARRRAAAESSSDASTPMTTDPN